MPAVPWELQLLPGVLFNLWNWQINLGFSTQSKWSIEEKSLQGPKHKRWEIPKYRWKHLLPGNLEFSDMVCVYFLFRKGSKTWVYPSNNHWIILKKRNKTEVHLFSWTFKSAINLNWQILRQGQFSSLRIQCCDTSGFQQPQLEEEWHPPELPRHFTPDLRQLAFGTLHSLEFP